MLLGKKILAIVPARGGSKGIKRKNVHPVCGQPLLHYTDDLVKQCSWIDCAVVSTDDQEIGNISKLKFPFLRPKEISGDFASDHPLVQHALIQSEYIYNQQFDIVLLLQPTSPMRREEDLLSAVEKLITGNWDSIMSVSETDSKGHPFKQFVLQNDEISHWSEEGSKIVARQQLSPTYHKDGIVYAMTRSCILEQKTIFGLAHTYQITNRSVINIDTLQDIEYFEFLLRKSEASEEALK